jgi:hypothetical protein
MLLDVINLTAIAIRRLIKTSKKINAFKNMCQEDQVALLKGGCTEILILRSAMTYDPDTDLWKVNTLVLIFNNVNSLYFLSKKIRVRHTFLTNLIISDEAGTWIHTCPLWWLITQFDVCLVFLLIFNMKWNLYPLFPHALFSCNYHSLSLIPVHCPYK